MGNRITTAKVRDAAKILEQAMFESGLIKSRDHILMDRPPQGNYNFFVVRYTEVGRIRRKTFLDDVNWEGNSHHVYYQLHAMARTIWAVANIPPIDPVTGLDTRGEGPLN